MNDLYTDLANYFHSKRYLPLIFGAFIVVLGVAIYLSYVDFMTSVEGYKMLGVSQYGTYEAYAAGFIPQAWQIVVGLSTAGLIAMDRDVDALGRLPIKMSRVMGAFAVFLFLVDFGTDVVYKIGGDWGDTAKVISAMVVSFVFFTIGSEVMLVFSFSMTLALWRAGSESVGNVIGTVVDGLVSFLGGIVKAITAIMRPIGRFFVVDSKKGGQPRVPKPSMPPSQSKPSAPPQSIAPPKLGPSMGGGGKQSGPPPEIRSAQDLQRLLDGQGKPPSGGDRRPKRR